MASWEELTKRCISRVAASPWSDFHPLQGPVHTLPPLARSFHCTRLCSINAVQWNAWSGGRMRELVPCYRRTSHWNVTAGRSDDQQLGHLWPQHYICGDSSEVQNKTYAATTAYPWTPASVPRPTEQGQDPSALDLHLHPASESAAVCLEGLGSILVY